MPNRPLICPVLKNKNSKNIFCLYFPWNVPCFKTQKFRTIFIPSHSFKSALSYRTKIQKKYFSFSSIEICPVIKNKNEKKIFCPPIPLKSTRFYRTKNSEKYLAFSSLEMCPVLKNKNSEKIFSLSALGICPVLKNKN